MYGEMDRQESAALLRRAKEGSPDALELLYDRLGPRLLAFIRLRLGRALRAQLESRDILQATFLKSFEHLRRFENSDSGSLMAWFARIAENEIRDRVDYFTRDRRDVRLGVSIDETSVDPKAGARSPLSQLILDERAERLEEALESLDAHYREVIVLRSFEELSFREIGDRLGRSEDACRMLFGRAMAALTMRMAPDAAGH
jgi:RNA polymerase sigma-70 factor (ECF subfamily)